MPNVNLKLRKDVVTTQLKKITQRSYERFYEI